MEFERIIKDSSWRFSSKPLKWQFYMREDRTMFNTDGIYFLLGDEEEVVYVGQSNDMLSRVRNHRGINSNKRGLFKDVGIIHLDTLDLTIFKSRSNALDFYERLFIKNIDPKLNKQRYETSLTY